MNIIQQAVVNDCEALAVRIAGISLDSNITPQAQGMLRYVAAIVGSLVRILAGILGA